MTSPAGKGSKRRPRDNRHCTRKQYENRYDLAFQKTKTRENTT